MWDPNFSSVCAILLALLVASLPAAAATIESSSSSPDTASNTASNTANAAAPTSTNTKIGPCAAAAANNAKDDLNNNDLNLNNNDLYATHPALCAVLDRVAADADAVAAELTALARTHHLLVGDGDEWGDPDELAARARKHHHHRRALLATSVVSATSTSTTSTSTTSTSTTSTTSTIAKKQEQQLPVVFAHGMGDSCFNNGMVTIGKHTASLLGSGEDDDDDDDVYVTCIPTGDTQTADTTNGYFLNMDKSVDVFAAKVAQDPNLAGGFHAMGFSQGNNVIRGYIARYNTPTVHTFVSVNGVNAGEGSVPGCFPDASDNGDTVEDDNNNDGSGLLGGSFCDLVNENASRRAYTKFAQEHSFQSNYWRDPRASEQEGYHTYSQLARWNNEVGPNHQNHHNQTLVENFGKTSKFVWIKATQDSMVWPSEGEHWGCPDATDPFRNPVLAMNETEWYEKDLFGLKTAQEAGKNVFETFEGDHLQFSMDDFDRWVVTYLAAATTATTTATANTSTPSSRSSSGDSSSSSSSIATE